jgi:hypothetical protein
VVSALVVIVFYVPSHQRHQMGSNSGAQWDTFPATHPSSPCQLRFDAQQIGLADSNIMHIPSFWWPAAPALDFIKLWHIITLTRGLSRTVSGLVRRQNANGYDFDGEFGGWGEGGRVSEEAVVRIITSL